MARLFGAGVELARPLGLLEAPRVFRTLSLRGMVGLGFEVGRGGRLVEMRIVLRMGVIVSNPKDIRREDVPPVSTTRIPPRGGSSVSDSVRDTAWTPRQSAYFLRVASDLWENMSPRQRRKLARADVGVYAVVKAIAQTRKGL